MAALVSGRGVAVGFGAAVLVALLAWSIRAGGLRVTETYGEIYVDSPEVYTRERLLNDRFAQDEWLTQRLDPQDATFGVQGTRSRAEGRAVSFQSALGVPSATPAASASASPPAPIGSGAVPRVSPIDEFRDRLAYREEVRSEIIENQLDDRHDIEGSTLYRFKFDVTLIPGPDTTAQAVVAVRLINPFPVLERSDAGFAEMMVRAAKDLSFRSRLGDLRSVYERWVAELDKQLNHTLVECRTEVRQRVDAGLFKLGKGQSEDDPPTEREASACEVGLDKALPSLYRAVKRSVVASKKDVPSNLATPLTRNDYPEFTRKLLNGNAPGALVDASEREFERLFIEWFVEDHLRETLSPAYARYVAVSATGDGSVRVAPLGAEERYYPDQQDKAKLEIALEDIKAKYGADLPPELLVVQGVTPRDRADGKPYQPNQTVVVVRRETGFAAFLAAILSHSNRVYTYAVTPKESAQRISTALSGHDAFAVGVGAGVGMTGRAAGAALSQDYEDIVRRDAIERRALVVGFSEDVAGSEGLEARFGWALGPRYRLGERPSDTITFRQTNSQQAVAAIVAVPAWWSEVAIAVDRYWLRDDGSCRESGGALRSSCKPFPPRPTTVSNGPDAGTPNLLAHEVRRIVLLPGDPTGVSDILFSVSKRPLIHKGDMGEQTVVVGEPAEVVIPGRYLWRSSKVTLGTQLASRISVLPNMGGVIAHFERINEPPDLGKSGVLTPKLTVWTSDGRDSDDKHVHLVRRPAPSAAPSGSTSAPKAPPVSSAGARQ
jgi:hypothetical protein